MKNILSLIACFIICLVLVQYRISNSDIRTHKPLKITEWDAFGYYMYLPAICIYHDVNELKWLAAIDKKYAVTGGNGYQAEKADNGNYVFKYLAGVAILELPFFLIGHQVAQQYGYPPDGFSAPYQYALGFGILFYTLLAILLLRKILLHCFTDQTVAITLLLICLATNFIQYSAVDSGQSHAYIFLLYVLILYSTLKWHRQPSIQWAALTGYVLGLATISRPTEAIMLFIPLMWDTHTKEAAKAKWQLVKQHKSHVLCAVLFGLSGILPQLIYWKTTSGSFLFDVGSKWDFLNPHFRVLFGWEKGWFIYTPVTVLFITGMFFLKKFPFRKSVLWFCLLNIYIIIGWHEWRYGGSYSTRALVQSYPVFALPLAAFVQQLTEKRWRIPAYCIFAYLLFVNLFQVTQYNSTVLHYDDMNRKYYSHIYLNPHPSPSDMSLLDNDEIITNENNYSKEILINADTSTFALFDGNATYVLAELPIANRSQKEKWLKITCNIKAPGCLWQTYLNAELKNGNSVKQKRIRLFSPISKNETANPYAFYVQIPATFDHSIFKLYLGAASKFEGIIDHISVTELTKK